jgi:hypothetical protein
MSLWRFVKYIDLKSKGMIPSDTLIWYLITILFYKSKISIVSRYVYIYHCLYVLHNWAYAPIIFLELCFAQELNNDGLSTMRHGLESFIS